MNKDQIKGRVDEAAGKIKKETGKLLNDEELKQKGRAQEVGGKVRSTYGDVKEDVKQEWQKDKKDLEKDQDQHKETGR
jgi:uncharacterized protein YjbJ (UPF0337 family)